MSVRKRNKPIVSMLAVLPFFNYGGQRKNALNWRRNKKRKLYHVPKALENTSRDSNAHGTCLNCSVPNSLEVQFGERS